MPENPGRGRGLAAAADYGWLISGEAQELYSVRHGPVRAARILPLPQIIREEGVAYGACLLKFTLPKDVSVAATFAK
ncbi:UNVERIFIED_CONTAM: hypothetical protein K2H54_035085 [Gekko kuhli]